MKKFLFKFSIIAVLVGTLASCEQEKVIHNGVGSGALAAFADGKAALEVIEDADASVTKIPVTVSNISNVDRAIVVSIDPESTALPTEYSIEASSLFIPANKYQGEIIVKGFFDVLEYDVVKTLTLKLESVGDAFVSPELLTVDILKPTCPFFGGTLITGTTFTGSSFIEGGFVTEFIPVITQSLTNPRIFTFNSFWGPNFVADATGNASYANDYLYGGTMTINGDFSVSISTTESFGKNATGVYNPCDNSFSYSLAQRLFGATYEETFAVDVTLVPNN